MSGPGFPSLSTGGALRILAGTVRTHRHAAWAITLSLLSAFACSSGDDAPNPEPSNTIECVGSPAQSSFRVATDPLSGSPFRWRSPVHLDIESGSAAPAALADEDAEAAIRGGLSLWPSSDCVDLEFDYRGTVADTVIGFTAEAPSQTMSIIFVESERDWSSRHTTVAVALTTRTTRPSTGEILDADIELNAFDYTWSAASPAASDSNADLQSLIAHELGHALGFEHAVEEASVMHSPWAPGWTRSTLTEGDRAGVCYLYACALPPL